MHPNNQRLSEDTSWQEWEKYYAHALEHPAGFELQFVRTIIQKLHILPYEVIPQYYFTDGDGKSRYADFMLIYSHYEIYVPIEIDGLSKMIDYDNTREEMYERFNDFLVRQNALIIQFGCVLRYSNKYWINNPDKVVQEIDTYINGLLYDLIYTPLPEEPQVHIEFVDRHIEKIIEREIEPRYPKVSPSLFGFIWAFIRYGWYIGYNQLHSYMKYKLDKLEDWIN